VFLRYLFFGAIPDVGGGDSLMKKVLAIVLSLMLLVVFAVGCQQKPAEKKAEAPKAQPVKAPETKAPDAKAADTKAADTKAPAEKENKQLKGLFQH
jgi:hypothetical protein